MVFNPARSFICAMVVFPVENWKAFPHTNEEQKGLVCVCVCVSGLATSVKAAPTTGVEHEIRLAL